MKILLSLLLVFSSHCFGYEIYQGPNGRSSDTIVLTDKNGNINNTSSDMFGRTRTAAPTTLFSIQNQYDRSPLVFEEWVSGTGAFSTLNNSSSIQYSTGGTAQGAYAYRQTKAFWRYQPGKNQEVIITRNIGALKTNVRQRVGIFNENDGIFLEQDGVNLKMVVRSSTSGAPVDTSVNRSAWQDCQGDGSGPSGFALDTSKQNIYFFEFQWLGSGNVVFGVYNGVERVVCNVMKFANNLTVPYMATPNLPVRGEIENIGTASSATTMVETCTTVISSGGQSEPFAYHFGKNTGVTAIPVTTRRAVLSIRPKATFGGLVNRADIDLLTFGVIVKTNDALCEIVYNPTFTGTPTWTSTDPNSTVEYSIHNDAAAGAITSGVIVDTSYIVSGQGQSAGLINATLESAYPIVLDHAGLNPIAMSLVCTSATGTSNVSAEFAWEEER